MMTTRRGTPIGFTVFLLLLLLYFLSSLSVARAQIIFSDDFEPGPEPVELYPRIEFVSDQMLLFDASGQSSELAVRVLDADGEELVDAQVEWTSALPSTVAVAPAGPLSATVFADDSWSGPIIVTVDYAPLGISAQALAVMAVPAPETVLLSSSLVLDIQGDRGGEHRIDLLRTPETEALRINDILVTGDLTGVMVRILEVELSIDRVILSVEPALATEAFEQLDLAVEGEPLQVTVRATRSETTVTIRSLRDGVLLQRARVPRNLVDDLECEGGLEVGTNLDVSVLTLERELIPRAGLRIDNFEVVDFLVLVEGSAGVDAGLSVSLSGGVTLAGKCSVPLPEILLPHIPLKVFTLGPTLKPEIGVRIDAEIQAGAQFSSPRLSRRWLTRAGVRYTPAQGWQTIEEIGYESGPESGASLTSGGGAQLKAGPFAKLDTNLRFNLGKPPIGIELTRLTFLELSGQLYWQLAIDTPVDPSHAGYTGPEEEAGVDAGAAAKLEATLFEGTLANYLPLTLETDIAFTLFSEQFVFYRSVTPALSVSCTPDCNNVPTNDSGNLTLTAQVDSTATGVVEFWASKNGNDTLTKLADAVLSGGQAQTTLSFSDAADAGSYTVYPRLKLDGIFHQISQVLPYAGNATASFTVIASDSPVIQVVPDTIEVPEGGSATVQVSLSQAPTKNVTITTTRTGGDADLGVQSGASLTFTSSDWDTPQPLTLAAAEDTDQDNGTATFTLSAPGLPDRLLIATEVDNDETLTEFDDRASFINALSGSLIQNISFDDIDADTDITGSTIDGVTFDLLNIGCPGSSYGDSIYRCGSNTSAPLFVVSGQDGLPSVSGTNLLSPGGSNINLCGPDFENDDLVLTFSSPTKAFGIDIIFESADGASWLGIRVLDFSNNIIFESSFISIPDIGIGIAGSQFIGLISNSENINRVEIDDFDEDPNEFCVQLDQHVGYDSIIFQPNFSTIIDFEDATGHDLVIPENHYPNLQMQNAVWWTDNSSFFDGQAGLGVDAGVNAFGPNDWAFPGASSPIVITFPTPVSEASIEAYDVGANGAVIEAFDGSTLVDSAQYIGSANGVDSPIQTLEVTAPSITRIHLRQAQDNEFNVDGNDGVGWDNLRYRPASSP